MSYAKGSIARQRFLVTMLLTASATEGTLPWDKLTKRTRAYARRVIPDVTVSEINALRHITVSELFADGAELRSTS